MLELDNQEQEKKKKIALIVMILTLIISVTGATFAFFMIAPETNNSVRGEAAYAELDLMVDRILPDDETWNNSDKVMAPHGTEFLGNVMSGDKPCIDSRNNIACQGYEIVITNKSTAQVMVDGTITYSGTSTMPNLKWKLVVSDTRLSSSEAARALANAEIRTIVEGESYYLSEDMTMKPVNTSNSVKYYYLVLWIEALLDENGKDMVQFDHGDYSATVNFVEAINGKGVTSTFTS